MNLTSPFAGARYHQGVTRKHRPLIWENMLGTVYARSPEGVTQYFDYDYAEAHAYAGTAGCEDLRVSRARYATTDIRARQLVLYGVRKEG
jgi:hypothetical protein